MTLAYWAIPFTNGQILTPAFLNDYVRTQIPKAIDGVGGTVGLDLTPSTAIRIGGPNGLILSHESGGTGRLGYTEREITRVQTGLLVNSTGAVALPYSLTVGVTEVGTQSLDRIPDKSTITEVTFYHDRDTGAAPVTRVTGSLVKVDLTTGSVTTIAGPTPDPAADHADYQLYHGFSLTGISEEVDNTTALYIAVLSGEDGTGLSTSMYPCTVKVLLTDQDEAP